MVYIYVPTSVTAEDIVPLEINHGKDIHSLVNKFADKYGVPRQLANYIVKNESGYIASKVGDINILCKRTNEAVYARGLMQITRCFHPEVSDAEAFNPVTNLKIAMKWASTPERCKQEFSTCRDYYALNP